jgi:uncharacterized protein (TIGR03067 family)
MSAWRAVWFVVAVLGFALSAPAAEKAKLEGDLAGLQGVWTGAAGAKKKIAVTMEIKGSAVSVKIQPPLGAPIRASGAIRIDTLTSPKSLDWVGFSAQDGQELPEILGIYELRGDTFKVCTGGPDNPRPSAFAPGEGMLADVVIFTRTAAAPPTPTVGLSAGTDPVRAE